MHPTTDTSALRSDDGPHVHVASPADRDGSTGPADAPVPDVRDPRHRPVDHAAWYAAALGWPVVPGHWTTAEMCSCGNEACATPAAHPLDELWWRTACTNTTCVRGRWRTHPQASVLVATGGDVLAVEMPAALGWGVLEILERHSDGVGPVVDARCPVGSRFWFFVGRPANGQSLRAMTAAEHLSDAARLTVHADRSWVRLPAGGPATGPVWSVHPIGHDRAANVPALRAPTPARHLLDAIRELVTPNSLS